MPLGLASTAQAASPPNDDFAQATVVSPDAGAVAGGVELRGNNEDASAEVGEPNHAASQYGEAFHSLWWSWTAPRAGSVSLDSCGTTFDTRLAVYTGSTVSALTEVASSNNTPDSGPCPGLLSYLTFDAVEGTTYHLAVDTDGPLSEGGEPRGDVVLHLLTPAAPDDTPDDPPDGGMVTTPGTVVPVETVDYKMPGLEPHRCSSCDRWQFEELDFANKKLGKALHDGQFYGSVKMKLLKNAPAKYRDDLYKAAPSTAIVKTKPHAGTVIHTSQAKTQTIVLYYWTPLNDRRYQRYLKDKLELENRHCKLLDATNNKLDTLLQALTYDQASKLVRDPAWGKCKVWVHDDGNAKNDFNSRIFRDYVVGVKKFPDQNGIGLVVTRPRQPDFAIVLREDPRFLTDPDFTSLVERADGWYLPVSPSTLKFTVQVVERSTGRLVDGARVHLWYVDSQGETRDLLDHTTDDDGDLAIQARFRKPMTLYISATVTSGSMQMESTRQVEVRNLGPQIQTPCGRHLTGSSAGGYQGDAAELNRCQRMEIVPGNLGDGRGSAVPHTASVTETEALTSESGTLLAGTFNAVDVSGENVIVGSGPGVLIIGGGSPAGYRSNDPRDLLSHLLTDIGSAFDQGVSNVKVTINRSDIDRINATQSVLASLGYAPAASSLITDKGMGVIAAGGGNVIAAGGANVIAAGGGNVIAAGGGNVIAAGGGNVIASGALNLMPVHGGAVIASGALN